MGDETPANPPAPAAAGVKKKKDEKYRKRDPRSWENVMRTTANMSVEEKQQHVENVYNELYNENRISHANLQARDKQYTQCLKEHEKDRAELTKSILARGQLESLCRELQKQNKLIKEENVARIKEEEDRRREVANTFNERLNALTSLITESKDKSTKVNEENQNMTQKLTELYDQYQQRENHLETVTRQLDLQKKLAETQAKKAEIEHEAERQTLLAQKRTLELQMEQYEREFVLYQEKNRSLEAQVDLYKSQYSDFETTMSKSNKVFDTFKEEMSRMSKQLHALEAERNELRKRWQSSVNSLLALSEQHMTLTNEQSALEKRLQMLQKLCRQLQEDRSAFLKQLKEHNIEPVVPSPKLGDNKVNENEEQEIDPSKNEARVMKLREELERTTKAVLDGISKDKAALATAKYSSKEIATNQPPEPQPLWPVNGFPTNTNGSLFDVQSAGAEVNSVSVQISEPVELTNELVSVETPNSHSTGAEVKSASVLISEPVQLTNELVSVETPNSLPTGAEVISVSGQILEPVGLNNELVSSETPNSEVPNNKAAFSSTNTAIDLSPKKVPSNLESSCSESTMTTTSESRPESLEPSPRDESSPLKS